MPRADFTYTGSYYARSFNRPIDHIDGYEVINAQLQLNGPEERWFVRAFVQNLTSGRQVSMLTSMRDMPQAFAALAGFILVVVTSLAIVRRLVTHEFWYLVHLVTYAAVLLALPHQQILKAGVVL